MVIGDATFLLDDMFNSKAAAKRPLLVAGNKITRGNGHLLLIPIQSELASIA